MNKAWGPFPEGKVFSIYLQRPGIVRNMAFAYVQNQRFAPGRYEVKFYLKDRLMGQGSASFPARWVAWQSGTIDRVDLTVTSGAATGVVLLNYLLWEG